MKWPLKDQKQVLNEIATEESFERQIKKDKIKSKQPEVQKAAINFTYEDGEGVVAKDDDKVDEGEDDEDSDDDGPGVALIEEVMNPSLLSDHDKSMIDNKAMVSFKVMRASKRYNMLSWTDQAAPGCRDDDAGQFRIFLRRVWL